MSYGIEVTGNNNVLQIDSSVGTRGLQVRFGSSGTSVSGVNPVSNLVLARRQTNGIFVMNRLSTSSYNFVNQFGSLVTVDYLVLTVANAFGTPTGDYGFQVFNSAGSLAFDSRNFGLNLGVEIISFASSPVANNTLLTSDKTNYIIMNWSFFQPGARVDRYVGVNSTTAGYTYVSNIRPTLNTEIPIAKTFT